MRGASSLSVFVCESAFSHDATLVLVRVRIFETKSLFRLIFLQVCQLFTVDGSSAFPAMNKRDSG